jgi:hypothetical protein
VRAWLEQPRRWQQPLTETIGHDQAPVVAGWHVARIAIAAAVVVGSVLSAQDWQALREPVLHRHLIVDAIAAFVLTPLALTIYLTLRAQTGLLLERLHSDGVIRPPTSDGKTALKEFAQILDRRLERKWVPTGALTAAYVIYTTADTLNGQAWPLTPLTWMALVVQAALLFVGVLAVAQVSATCRAIGDLRSKFKFEVWVQPLHPDGCGGLWPIGHLLSLVLFAAAIIGGSSLCIFLALKETPSALSSRPEPYLLAVFYAILLPLAFDNLLWRPHKLMWKRRTDILTQVAKDFNTAIAPDKSSMTEAAADSPSEIAKRFQVLDEACPTWPLGVRRLWSVTVTAVLPVAIPVVTALFAKFLTPGS